MCKSFTCPPKSEILNQWVTKHYSDYKVFVAYEAGCCGFEPHRDFIDFGWSSIVFNPADITRKGSSAFHKTDQIDARLICQELRDARLQSITIPDRKREELRALFRRRVALVRDFRRIKSQIKMQLLFLGVEIPAQYDKAKWSHAFRKWLKSLKCYFVTGDYLVESQLSQYEYLEANIRDISNKLRAYCRKHYKKDYYLLKSIPGIGGIVACGILSELGDLRRFSSAKQLAAYVGFVPYIRQSGNTTHTFGITPRANHIIRSYFVEAAWQALRLDPVMQNYYSRHQGKDSKKIIIKIARKLLLRTRAVIISGLTYEIGLVQ